VATKIALFTKFSEVSYADAKQAEKRNISAIRQDKFLEGLHANDEIGVDFTQTSWPAFVTETVFEG